MTNIIESISWMQRDLGSRRHAERFEEARVRLAAFKGHASIAALIASMERARRADRDAIVRALAEEYGRSRHPLWSTLLIVVCRGMLFQQRAAIANDAGTSDDLDQVVFDCFLSALRLVVDSNLLGERIVERLRAELRKGILRAVRLERLEHEWTEPCDHRASPVADFGSDHGIALFRGPPSAFPPRPNDLAAQRAMLERLGALDLLRADVADMLLHTLSGGDRLIDYVRRVHAGASARELRRLYQRDKRRRSRAVALLRAVLSPLRHKRWRDRNIELAHTAADEESCSARIMKRARSARPLATGLSPQRKSLLYVLS